MNLSFINFYGYFGTEELSPSFALIKSIKEETSPLVSLDRIELSSNPQKGFILSVELKALIFHLYRPSVELWTLILTLKVNSRAPCQSRTDVICLQNIRSAVELKELSGKGAHGRTRTDTSVSSQHFKCCAYANSATRASLLFVFPASMMFGQTMAIRT